VHLAGIVVIVVIVGPVEVEHIDAPAVSFEVRVVEHDLEFDVDTEPLEGAAEELAIRVGPRVVGRQAPAEVVVVCDAHPGLRTYLLSCGLTPRSSQNFRTSFICSSVYDLSGGRR